MARFGKRYYPVDPSYDKRVYENDCFNYFKIIGCLFAFWICNALHWWGVFSLGIVNSNALAWYAIGCFFFTIFFLAGLMTSGYYANKLKRQHEFYVEKLAERKAEAQEKETKAEQERIHAEKVAEHQRKLAEIMAKNKQSTQTTGAGAPTLMQRAQQIVTNIQDPPAQQ